MNKILTTLSLLSLTTYFSFGQGVEMANIMRSNGKIYVVVAVVLILFLGFFFYLLSIDKKVSQLENKINKK